MRILDIYNLRIGIQFIFAWYRLWIGIYIDRKGQTIYLLPLPMMGLRISWIKK